MINLDKNPGHEENEKVREERRKDVLFLLLCVTLSGTYLVIMCIQQEIQWLQMFSSFSHINYQQQEVTGNGHLLNHDVTIRPINLFSKTHRDETCFIYLDMMRK